MNRKIATLLIAVAALALSPIPSAAQQPLCRRRLNFDPPCRSNIDPGMGAAVGMSGCG
jgi:hypothetical protein